MSTSPEMHHEELQLTAQPERITSGGIVLITAQSHTLTGIYEVEWTVTGPVPLSSDHLEAALIGETTVKGAQVELINGIPKGGLPMRATLDTNQLLLGPWQVSLQLVEVLQNGGTGPEITASTEWIDVLPRPFAAGDDVAVTLKRTAIPPTPDQALWVAIRASTNAIGFDRYEQFLDAVLCGELADTASSKDTKHVWKKVKQRTAVPFPNVERYRLLKAATEVFLMINCGAENFSHLNLGEESRRLQRAVDVGDIEAQWREYLTGVNSDDGFIDVIPYLALIRRKLGDVAVLPGEDDDRAADVCYGILAEKLTNPCFLELIWSYWAEEAGLVQAMNAICWRFQNRAVPGHRDPLAGLEIDPLRPLSNILWGRIQDGQHRLTTVRRANEYAHQYGYPLAANPRPAIRSVDTRQHFIEAFHNLLRVCSNFYPRDDDTTVIADGFGVLNALKETHMILTQGSHNQYGDLPWTARHEMLMDQWILARPEMREYLPTRIMTALPEAWMDRVEAMNRLQGWSETSVLHFRDLAVFGEQLLLGIRFGAWTTVVEPEQAANWARYWRSEVQQYTHAYRAVTGVDLTQRVDSSPPARYLRQRQLAQHG